MLIPSGKSFRVGMRTTGGGNGDNISLTGTGKWQYFSHSFIAFSSYSGEIEGSENSAYSDSTVYYLRDLKLVLDSGASSNNNLTYLNNAMFYPEFIGTGVNETIVKKASKYGRDVLSCTGTAGQDYIKFTSPWPSGSTVTDTSVAIWFKISNTNTGYYPLFYPGDGRTSTWSGISGIWLSYNCESVALWEYDKKTGNYLKYGSTLPAGWHYIVFTMESGTTQKFYLDGTEVHSATISGSVTNGQSTYCVGNAPNDWSGVMDGTYIADVAVYARALKAAEIESNYHTMAEIHKDNSVTAVTLVESEENPTTSAGSSSTYKYPFFSENGTLTARAFAEELELDDGSVWVPIMHHNNNGGANLFTYGDDFSKFVYHNQECWAKFNIINDFSYSVASASLSTTSENPDREI